MSHPRYRTLWSLVLDGGLRSWNPEKLRLVLSPQRQFDSPRTRLNEVYVEYQDQNSYLSGFLIFSIVLGRLASLASLLLFSLATCASSLRFFISYKRKMLLSLNLFQKFTNPPLPGPGVPLLLPRASSSSSSNIALDGGLKSWNPEKLRLILLPQCQFDSPRTRLNKVFVGSQNQTLTSLAS